MGRHQSNYRLEALEVRVLLTAQLVRDIHLPGLEPRELLDVGGRLFFAATTSAHGYELWTSDGTAAGTTIVRDIKPGADSSFVSPSQTAGNLNGMLVFSADDGANGQELWRSDGTRRGTFLLKDLAAGKDGSSPHAFRRLGRFLYFRANATSDDTGALWRTDGTAAGTTQVSVSTPVGHSLVVVGERLVWVRPIFSTQTLEIWSSDGTVPGTSRIKRFPNSTSSLSAQITPAGDLGYFAAPGSANGPGQLWRTDGTAEGTRPVGPAAGALPELITPAGEAVFFRNGFFNSDLWRSDGTVTHTELVKDMPDGNGLIESITAVGGNVFFTANGPAAGVELWTSNGTAAGTRVVRDINAGGGSSKPNYLAAAGNTLYFRAHDGAGGVELWKSNGKRAGTVLVKDIWPGSGSSAPKNIKAVGNRIYFVANDGNGLELWTSDGTAAGTRRLTDRTEASPTPSRAAPRHPISGNLLFVATDPSNGRELWKTDGTSRGTVLLRDIKPGPEGSGSHDDASTQLPSGPSGFTPFKDHVYFVADDGMHGPELWRTNGTEAGTTMFLDLLPGESGTHPQSLVVAGNLMFFWGWRGAGSSGSALFRTDGTAAGTFAVYEPRGAAGSVSPGPIAAVGSRVFFSGFASGRGHELFTSDGTARGTGLVKDINAGASNSSPGEFTTVGNTLYFAATTIAHGRELWKTDGTSAGTLLVKDVTPGSDSTSIFRPVVAGGRLYFGSIGGGTASGMWTSDGTAAGTVRLAEFGVWPVAFNRKVLFGGSTTSSSDIYITDGTIAGTKALADINKNGYGNVAHILPVGNVAYFVGTDGTSQGIYRTDGTPAGTVRIGDAPPSEFGVSELAAAGGNVYFPGAATTGDDELWRLAPGGTVALPGIVSGVVFHDRDGDGRPESGESRLAGYRAFIDKNNNGAFDSREPSTRSDPTGNYALANLPVGTYTVRLTRVAGWGPTGIDAFRVKVEAGRTVRRHFGVAPRGSAAGLVFRDNNRNGTRDIGEGALVGWRVYVDADRDGVLDAGERATRTNVNGLWTFDDLPGGTYRVRVEQPDGWRLTTPSRGFFSLAVVAGQHLSGGYLFGQKRIV